MASKNVKYAFEIVEKVDNIKKIAQGQKMLRNYILMVGIPEEKSDRRLEKPNKDKREKLTNAELLFIHTNGSPINHIPARPVIEPALEYHREVIADLTADAVNAALEGDERSFVRNAKLSGMEAVNRIKDWFYNSENNWPPNAISTYLRKKKKGATENRPLIDTAQMKNAITYVFEKGGEREE